MTRRIAIIQGHPDPAGKHYCHALAASYAKAAEQRGHSVRTLNVAGMQFPLLRSAEEWEGGSPNAAIQDAQRTIAWAEHLLIVFPLWLGDMPALLKAFFEQVFRPGFAIRIGAPSLNPGLLKGKSARVIVTMGMPALLYRWFFRGHSLRSLERNILKFAGFRPVRSSVIGGIEAIGDRGRRRWLERVKALGRRAQ
jgi:putative NADPH-quinone reductase